MPHYIFLQKKKESLEKYGDNLNTGPVCVCVENTKASQVNLFQFLFLSLLVFARFYKTTRAQESKG